MLSLLHVLVMFLLFLACHVLAMFLRKNSHVLAIFAIKGAVMTLEARPYDHQMPLRPRHRALHRARLLSQLRASLPFGLSARERV